MKTLQERRLELGLSQSQFASRAGINVRKLQDYEQGHSNINKAAGETIYKLAKALDCTMEDLLDLDQIK